MLTLTKLFHSTLGQISAIITYNVVGKTKAKNHLFLGIEPPWLRHTY